VETVKKVSPSDFHLLTINFCYRNSLYIKLFTPYIGYGANNTHIEQVYLWAHIHIFPGNLCYGPISQLNLWISNPYPKFSDFLYNTDRARLRGPTRTMVWRPRSCFVGRPRRPRAAHGPTRHGLQPPLRPVFASCV
jgi:hypothetical protein